MADNDTRELNVAPVPDELESDDDRNELVRRPREQPSVSKRGQYVFRLSDEARQVFEGPDPAAWRDRGEGYAPDAEARSVCTVDQEGGEHGDGWMPQPGVEDQSRVDETYFINGSVLAERASKGLSFPFPIDDSTLFGLQASMTVNADGKPVVDPVRGWDARWQELGSMASLLIEKDVALFCVLERVAHALVSGTLSSTARPPRRGRGRPKPPEKDVEAITARLRGLKTDDDARKYLRQALSTCAVGANTQERRARDNGSPADRTALADTHHAAYLMLREELDRLACGLRLPRMANVLLVLLDDRGCDRGLLAKAAAAAGVLKTGADRRKNLADHLGATRKELTELEKLSTGFAKHVEECAWWPMDQD